MKAINKLIQAIALTITFFVSMSAHSFEAHVHGLSELTIAMEESSVEIQFTSPAMNLVGFEHRANTPKEIASVRSVSSTLRHDNSLFTLANAQCKHIDASVNLTDLIDPDNNSDHKDAQHHKHKNIHEANAHAEHSDHGEIIARYKYRCAKASTLNSITVNLFNDFPAIDKIQVMWIKQGQQGSIMLTPDNRIIRFR